MGKRGRESERDSDVSRLDEAIDYVLSVLRVEIPRSGDADADAVNEAVMAKTKLEACKGLVPLLERRAKLLGLDATPNEQPAGESVLQRMQREIASQGNGAAKS